jgi:hypothetical protein
MYFQQLVTNKFHDSICRAFEESAAKDPVAHSSLLVGQAVLIDWPNSHGPPSQLHPKKRGPYKVTEVHTNRVLLDHLSPHPPPDQPKRITWSAHAHVFQYADDRVPLREARDPSASQVPAGVQQRRIDCVLSHSPQQDLRSASLPANHVRNNVYLCRLCSAVANSDELLSTQRAPVMAAFCYDEICHTYAFDSYILSNHLLTGHVPVAHMPSNWSPHAVVPTLRPAHPALPLHEHSFPADSVDGRSQ